MRITNWARQLLLVPALMACSSLGEQLDEQTLDLSKQSVDSRGKQFGALSSEILRLNPDDPHLVARLSIDPDGLLEFYEFEPGSVSLSGAGRAGPSGLDPADFETDDAGRIWDIYSQGASRPEALDAALNRRLEDRAIRADKRERVGTTASGGAAYSEIPDTGTGTGGPQLAYVGGYCDTWYYTHNEAPWNSPMADCPDWDWVECFDNWSGGRYIRSTSVTNYYANSCAKIGGHVFSAHFGSSGGNWTVPEESGRWYRYLLGDDKTAVTQISEATNSVFHHRHWVIQ
jgi:hypothetical protein